MFFSFGVGNFRNGKSNWFQEKVRTDRAIFHVT
jgi:hypothetical protein